MATRFALVDVNNFYVSCERLYDPTLLGVNRPGFPRHLRAMENG